MTVKLTRYEKETIITFNEAEDTANIYSTSDVWIRKIKAIKGSRKYSIGYEVDVPKSWIRLQRPAKVTEETKKKRLAALQIAQAKRKKMLAEAKKTTKKAK